MTVHDARPTFVSTDHTRRLIDDHFRGRTTPKSEHRMRAHLVDCATCRDYYNRHIHLAAVDPHAALSPRTRLRRGLGLREPATAVGARTFWLRIATSAAAISVCAVAVLHWSAPEAPTTAARGVGMTIASQLLVYEVVRTRPVRQVGTEMDRNSGLAFAYVNSGHRSRLLVFGVDDQRRVYWYHPAWTDPRESPGGVTMALDDAVHELAQAVTHPLQGQRLQLFGVFSDQAISVRDVERAVREAPLGEHDKLALTFPGAEIARIDLTLSGVP